MKTLPPERLFDLRWAASSNSVLPGPTASQGVTEFVGQLAREKRDEQRGIREGFFPERAPNCAPAAFSQPNEIAVARSSLASAINGASVRADDGVIKSIA